jgi:hypothetical protein
METAGRVLVVLGVALVALGALFVLLSRLGVSSLPGDIIVRGKHATLYVPIGLSILLSVLLTLAANLFWRR